MTLEIITSGKWQTNFCVWMNRLVSTLQALMSAAAGWLVCNHSCRRSVRLTSHYMSDVYAWFGAAYFYSDIWHMYRIHRLKVYNHDQSAPSIGNFAAFCAENRMMMFHHLFLGTFGLLTIVVRSQSIEKLNEKGYLKGDQFHRSILAASSATVCSGSST